MNSSLEHIVAWAELAQKSKWSVTTLAKLCRISPRTLGRHFIKTKGKRPSDWLAEHRQSRAIELLEEGCSVKEISCILGYRHSTHFSRSFKKYWGYSPTDQASACAETVEWRKMV